MLTVRQRYWQFTCGVTKWEGIDPNHVEYLATSNRVGLYRLFSATLDLERFEKGECAFKVTQACG